MWIFSAGQQQQPSFDTTSSSRTDSAGTKAGAATNARARTAENTLFIFKYY
jgi:hypothetical protein